jgi:transcriptional regulator of NAD metabolism
MEFSNGLGDMAIQDVIKEHPVIGEILAKYDIGCVTCRVGICLLKDVVSIHGLTAENEAAIESEINTYLKTKNS